MCLFIAFIFALPHSDLCVRVSVCVVFHNFVICKEQPPTRVQFAGASVRVCISRRNWNQKSAILHPFLFRFLLTEIIKTPRTYAVFRCCPAPSLCLFSGIQYCDFNILLLSLWLFFHFFGSFSSFALFSFRPSRALKLHAQSRRKARLCLNQLIILFDALKLIN